MWQSSVPRTNMSLFYPLIQVFRYVLQPIAPFTWFGLSISTLDVVAAFRLCLALRQIRESTYAKHLSSKAGPAEEKSFIKNLSTTLLVVYGGEAAACIFMFSIHTVTCLLTSIPFISYIHRHTSLLHALRCIPKSLCCSSSCCRCPTYCAHTLSRNRTTFISYRWIYSRLSLVQSYSATCNNKYLDTDIIFPLDIADHFSGKSPHFFGVQTLINTVHTRSSWPTEVSS
jgi:hypothetical protein